MDTEEYQGNQSCDYLGVWLRMPPFLPAEKVTTSPFLFLSLDLPATPLFQVHTPLQSTEQLHVYIDSTL